MKRLYFIFLLIPALCLCQTINKDELTGIWQADTSLVGSEYGETYQFFADGKFIYNSNPYDGLHRVASIIGKYSIKKDTLFIMLESTIERKGGVIVRSELTTLSDSWEIQEYELIEKKLPPTETQTIGVEKRKPEGTKCLLLDKRKYFKVADDPNKF